MHRLTRWRRLLRRPRRRFRARPAFAAREVAGAGNRPPLSRSVARDRSRSRLTAARDARRRRGAGAPRRAPIRPRPGIREW